jgi:predicted GNAT family acetyltransferase
VRLERFEAAPAFFESAEPFLLAREAEHALILGLGAQLRTDPRAWGEQAYFAVVRAETGVVAAALRTPPHNLVLSQSREEDACVLLAEDALRSFAALPGVTGPTETVEWFVRAWAAHTGRRGRLALAQRIYRAGTARPPKRVPGRMRPYHPRDRALVLTWLEAFLEDAGHAGAPEAVGATLERRLQAPGEGFALWEAGAAVSLAGFGGPTPHGIRIGPVYTPPEHRRHGYASALVAALTGALLEGGRRFCVLYTDRSNATSNAIYQRVGYVPVADASQWLFD